MTATPEQLKSIRRLKQDVRDADAAFKKAREDLKKAQVTYEHKRGDLAALRILLRNLRDRVHRGEL